MMLGRWTWEDGIRKAGLNVNESSTDGLGSGDVVIVSAWENPNWRLIYNQCIGKFLISDWS